MRYIYQNNNHCNNVPKCSNGAPQTLVGLKNSIDVNADILCTDAQKQAWKEACNTMGTHFYVYHNGRFYSPQELHNLPLERIKLYALGEVHDSKSEEMHYNTIIKNILIACDKAPSNYQLLLERLDTPVGEEDISKHNNYKELIPTLPECERNWDNRVREEYTKLYNLKKIEARIAYNIQSNNGIFTLNESDSRITFAQCGGGHILLDNRFSNPYTIALLPRYFIEDGQQYDYVEHYRDIPYNTTIYNQLLEYYEKEKEKENENVIQKVYNKLLEYYNKQ